MNCAADELGFGDDAQIAVPWIMDLSGVTADMWQRWEQAWERPYPLRGYIEYQGSPPQWIAPRIPRWS